MVVLRFTLLSCALALGGPAWSQAGWPDHPIQFIVPFPAGGGIDVIARPFAERFGELLHQAVVVIARDGASGTIGMGAVASARPDGYTLAFSPSGPLTIQPHVIPTLAYKPESLQPICQLFASEYVLAVRADSPYKSLDDFVKAAKARPGKLTYGFGGVATSPHLAIAEFANAAHLDMLGVPFRGDPAAILALRAGDIDSATLNIGLAKAQRFRALATFAEKRQAEYPDTPTMKEAGFQVVSTAYGGLIGPKGMPADVVKKLEAACETAGKDERFQNAVRQASQEPIYRNAADFARVLAEDSRIKQDVIKRAGIKAP
ncbi:MAG TPA: tripartite tricarboxylate transporter substrate binding protein [Casimicrobiaceae bacterium]|nr:tripartite tricarboxylate transporter substrate binding protein [Casimicrobiaceae bacterium]